MILGDEKGFTLVELLMATAISGLVASLLVTTIYQLTSSRERAEHLQRALQDVQNVGSWLTLDGDRAESTNLVDGASPVGSMMIAWTSEGQAHTIDYYLSGAELKRDHNGTVITVARHVSAIQFSLTGQLVTVNMTSTPPGRWGVTKQADYRIWVRPTN